MNTSEYSLGAGHTSFAQLYAIDKLALEAGTATSFVHFSNLTTDTGTIQPATTPSGRFATGHGGTEYFMSSQDCIARLQRAAGTVQPHQHLGDD